MSGAKAGAFLGEVNEVLIHFAGIVRACSASDVYEISAHIKIT